MSARRLHQVLLVCGLAPTLVGATALSAQPRAGVYAAAIAKARQLVRDSLASNGSPGVSVAVSVDGVNVWEEGFGYADLEAHVPVSPRTRFRIGSVSKSLTSIALGRLVQEGRLDLDAEVQRYAPTFPRKRWPLTVREVGGHLGGIRHYQGDEVYSARPYANVTAALDIFKDDSLVAEPGTAFNYSSYGFNLLSVVIEGAAGMPFLSYISANVLSPLGMRQTSPDFVDSIIPNRARFYDREEKGAWTNARYVDQSNKWAGGGFLSTPHDLLLLAHAIMKPGLLQPPTIAMLTTSQRTRAGKATEYGIGWFVVTPDTGKRMVFHSGGSVGGTTHLVAFPDQGVVVAMTVNAGGEVWIGTGRVPRQVAQLFIDAKARR
ncbi:MAG: serine hydrolase domain-containing protein [Gemmatimonadaceae bacterium]